MKSLSFKNALMQSKAYSLLRNDFGEGLSHAYMIVSSDDDVIDEFFTLVSASVFCSHQPPCFECAECRKVVNDNNADIFHLYPQKDKIKVEDLSLFLRNISVKPLEKHKIYFIHRADQMNVQAQNKLLKTLEEPPQYVTIFLGVSNESSMLDTIKSRVHTVYMDVFDNNTVYDTLKALDFDEDAIRVAIGCCEGRLGKAVKIATSPQYSDLYKSAIYILDNLSRSSDVVKVDGIASTQNDIGGFLDVLSIIVRDMLVSKQNENLVLSKHVSSKIISIASRYSQRALADILIKINDVRKEIALNVSVVSSIDNLLFTILEDKHKWQ